MSDVRSDTELWDLVRRGDGDAFARLFDRHASYVYNLAFRRTGSWDAAEDIAEVTFLEAWRQRHRVSLFDGSLKPWLSGTGANLARRWWRDQDRQRRAIMRLASNGHSEDHADDVVGAVSAASTVRQVLGRLDELPDDQREVLLLATWERLSYEEIAAALDVPVGTVRSRLSRAREALGPRGGTQAGEGARADESRAAALEPGVSQRRCRQ